MLSLAFRRNTVGRLVSQEPGLRQILQENRRGYLAGVSRLLLDNGHDRQPQ